MDGKHNDYIKCGETTNNNLGRNGLFVKKNLYLCHRKR